MVKVVTDCSQIILLFNAEHIAVCHISYLMPFAAELLSYHCGLDTSKKDDYAQAQLNVY